ncbi:murein biosynthesis integral membrane protein MurJ [Methylocystis iwaonis]|uniref:Probable lipid II flippase MurJ n=1 Tax=Methylocystis iwaonis TaxID=2885079 RepID=A0ABM8E8M9_9HYPH|nr:murein biosynthesis integral membrane protein MurJ [Methylocystis iwaonis]BDV34327.1 putative lipid II flippase MurJ [Methylocystis iwaonis]
MIRNLLSVGGFTLLSRLTGFLSLAMQSAIMGAGVVSDAFFIAQRLPNSFRSIFGEGAFNAAYIPCYAKALEQDGPEPAEEFAGEVYTLLLVSQIVLLALVWLFAPQFVGLLAPGLGDRPEKFALAVSLTRITFPYLVFMTLFALHMGTLNAHGRFALPAFAPNLMNLTVMAALAVAFLFPNAGYAASWGVTISGALELGLLMWGARRIGVLRGLRKPHWPRVREFFINLGPAVIGSASPQIAVFADTILSSMLADGGVSAISYAERLYQLPIGVIGIAAGTVLLPEMSRRIAAGDVDGAHQAQSRTMALTIALAAPFFIAFVTIPELIVAGLFMRGRFTAADAIAAGDVLAAYGGGLMALVLIASAKASFQSRGDTATPMKIALAALAVNVALKIVLFQPLGAVGLATATSVQVWVNLGALLAIAIERGFVDFDRAFAKTLAATVVGCALLAMVAAFGRAPALAFGAHFGSQANLTALVVLGAAGGIIYGAALAGALHLMGIKIGALRARAKRSPALV